MTILKSLSYQTWYVRHVWIIIANDIEEESNFLYCKSVSLLKILTNLIFFLGKKNSRRTTTRRRRNRVTTDPTQRFFFLYIVFQWTLVLLCVDIFSFLSFKFLGFFFSSQVVDFARFCRQGLIKIWWQWNLQLSRLSC